MNQIHDAFSSGQIGSKLWLCEQAEKYFETIDSIWIYGGWYGLTAFLLRARNKINIGNIRSFDLKITSSFVTPIKSVGYKIMKNFYFQ